MNVTREFRLALVLFFGSGLCALAYETVWVRQLTLSFGISVYAVSAVLAAYMFGLCVGAYAIGRFTHRIRNPLRVYALFELGIIVYTFLLYFVLEDFVPNLYRVGYDLLPDVPFVLTAAKFIATFLLLAVPTTLMGGTLPVLASFLRRSPGEVGGALGRLYGINTLGGAAGTALAGFWLLKDAGIFATTGIALVLNVAIALTALAFARSSVSVEPAPAKAAAAVLPPGARLVSVVLVLSGYTALSYEVIWNRSLLLYTHNSTYAFSLILIVFLVGTALGSLMYGLVPERLRGMRALGVVQLALAGFIWISVPLTGQLPGLLSGLTDAIGTDSFLAAMIAVAVSPIVIVLLPTIMMGFTFPAATALMSASREEIGSATGRAYAHLTIGNIAGSILTGFLLIGWLGLRDTFAVGIFCNLLAGLALVFFRPGRIPRSFAFATAGAAVSVLVFQLTVQPDIFRSYYEEIGEKIVYYKEEIADTVMVFEDRAGERYIFYSDGRGTASTVSNFMNRLYGHIPMLLQPRADSVLSICLGVGNSLSAMAQHAPHDITCVELSPGAVEAAAHFPTNLNVLEDPNLEIDIDDGRNFLLRTEKKFDVIQLEPPELHQAGVVNLFTKEFYELARKRLTEGGIVCQWFSTLMPEYERKMVIKTFADVFPHSSLWSGNSYSSLVLIGSPDPIRVRAEDFLANAREPGVSADLARMGVNAFDVLARHLMAPETLRAYVDGVPAITDDRTYVDFSIPRSKEAGYGVFTYNTYRFFKDAPASWQEQFRYHSQLERHADSPDYLFDFEGSDREAAELVLTELGAALNRYRGLRASEYAVFRGEQSLVKGDVTGAQKLFREAVRYDPTLATAHFGLARVAMKLTAVDVAERHVQRALELEPSLAPAQQLLARIQRQRQRVAN